jgi:CPA2 family monovalent cation:H+ antiporter-2
MTADMSWRDYKEPLVFLATAGVIAPLFNRFRVSPILGFLLAGVALGPQGLGRLTDAHPVVAWVTLGEQDQMAPFAELGVVFLLFMVGLELSWERLKTLRRLILGLGLPQVVVCAGLIAAGAELLGEPPVAALIIGVALSMSSTALVLPALAERKRLASDAGRASVAVLLAQDLAVAPILVSITLISNREAGERWSEALITLAPAAVALAAIIVAGRLLLRPLFHSAARAKSPDMFVAASLLIVVGAGAAASAGGLSMPLGAFVAGLLLAETEFRREVEVVLDPFRGLLLGMFFVSVGAELNIDRLIAEPALIVALTLTVALLKSVATFGLGRLVRLPARSSAESALVLGPAGEFAFVIAAQAGALGLVGGGAVQVVVVSTTLGLFLVPLLAWIGSVASRPGRETAAAEFEIPAAEPQSEGGVLVVGYGRVGRLVGEMLRVHKIEFTAIDSDPVVVAAGKEAGARLYFGDAAREAFLKACGVGSARAVVVTMDAPAKVDEVVRQIRAMRPDVTLIARARDARHAEALYRLGVTDAVPEAIEASLQLAENALVDLGVPMGLVIASIHEKRDEFRRRFSGGGAEQRPYRAIRQASRTPRSDPSR